MSLKEYVRRGDLAKTTEPEGGTRGRYALVHIKPRAGEKDINRLFFKMK